MHGVSEAEEESEEEDKNRRCRDCLLPARISFVLLCLFSCLLGASSLPLHPLPPLHREIAENSYLRYYEPVLYDPLTLKQRRAARSVSSARQPVVLRLRAFDRSWTVKLYPDDTVFSRDVVFEGTDGPITFDATHSYSGTVLEDENAIVQGIVTKEGLFDGTLSTRFEEFYIEPISRYLTNANTSPTYHSIGYRSTDIDLPRHGLSCGLSSGFPSNLTFDAFYEPFLKTDSFYTFKERKARNLQKRATVDPRKTTCMLYLQADHQFFARYGSEDACIEVMTRHVQRVNAIYKRTDFDQDGKPDNISFMIKRIKVHTEEALKDPSYRFPGNYGVEKYLELFSEEDYDAFCLAYMFTYRDFEMGTLGLAWTGDLKNAGGVCEKNGHYRGSMKSLNTGIVTLLNYGKHVPPAVSHVTLAHEIGHNFGSPHDPAQCTPGGDDGNFIMFARATSGDQRNNNRFSPCSLKSMNPVLNSKARSPKGCFTEPQISLCGNGIVEEGEECDCGWEEDCRDTCCFPQRRYPPANEKPCTLTPNAVCSPSQGPCCTGECTLKFGDKCREDNGCREPSFCDGRSPECPPSINRPNRTICNQEFVCFMGECTGSICLAYGLESCQCIPGPEDPATKACELCCRFPGENQPCISSFEWNSPPYDIPDLFSKPGTPCNDYNGYCDPFRKCREVDPSGPLATLRKFLLSEESLASFRRWISEHWYAAVLTVFAAVSLLIASIRLLGKRTGLSKLKSVTIVHSPATEAVRLPEGPEVTVHPPAIRAKLPLSKKVREKGQRQRSAESPRRQKSRDPAKKKKRKKKRRQEEPRKPVQPDRRKPQRKPAKDRPKPIKEDPTSRKKSRTDPNVDPITKEKENFGFEVRNKVSRWLLEHPSRSCQGQEKPKVPAKGQRSQRRELAKLQVIYRPPFRFCVRIGKSDRVAQAPVGKKLPRTGVLLRKRESCRRKRKVEGRDNEGHTEDNQVNDIHTVPSDLEVLLSESEFLFSEN